MLHLAPGRTVAEIGAGTGKFIPALQATKARIIAVEPVDQMRSELARAFPAVEALPGTADALPLADECLDGIVCAQAFHWFATAAALAEMHRVLRPGGMLGLIWNGRDESVPWVAALSAITDRHEGDAPRYKSGAWRRAFPADGFAFVDDRRVRTGHVGPAEQVVLHRTLSVSFIAGLPAQERAGVEREVRALIARTPELADDGDVTFPYETRMVAYRRLQGELPMTGTSA